MELKDMKEMAELFIDRTNLDTLVNLIVDNADLNYTGERLRITNEETIVQFIKCIYPNTYQDKLRQLKENKKDNAE